MQYLTKDRLYMSGGPLEGQHVEAGEIIDETVLNAESIPLLLEIGVIVPAPEDTADEAAPELAGMDETLPGETDGADDTRRVSRKKRKHEDLTEEGLNHGTDDSSST